MIRAHLATFPPRQAPAEQVVDQIAPQVEALFVVLNGYDRVPEAMARHKNVTTQIPDRDVKDAGKFWFAPEPSDRVFLIDDDIGYPSDYVARMLSLTRRLDLERNVFGYQGHALQAPDKQNSSWRWRNFLFRRELGRIRGVSVIGTGTLFALGRNIAPLDVMESAAGFCDIRYARWLFDRGILPWALPRQRGYLSNELPDHLWESSLFRTVNRQQRPDLSLELWEFAWRWPHADVPFRRYAAGVRARGAERQGPWLSVPPNGARPQDAPDSD